MLIITACFDIRKSTLYLVQPMNALSKFVIFLLQFGWIGTCVGGFTSFNIDYAENFEIMVLLIFLILNIIVSLLLGGVYRKNIKLFPNTPVSIAVILYLVILNVLMIVANIFQFNKISIMSSILVVLVGIFSIACRYDIVYYTNLIKYGTKVGIMTETDGKLDVYILPEFIDTKFEANSVLKKLLCDNGYGYYILPNDDYTITALKNINSDAFDTLLNK